jgi:hypothetical protein
MIMAVAFEADRLGSSLKATRREAASPGIPGGSL